MPDYKSLPHLTPVRRLVTGHDSTGKAIFHRDELITPVTASSSDPDIGFALIHRTRGYPVDNQGTDTELAVENLQRSKGPAGIVCEIVDIPPAGSGQPPLLHRNRSLDYGVILNGEIILILDDGAEQTLSEGDVFVQRGTMHAWKNTSDARCRFLTVIVPAQDVVIGTGEVLTDVKLPGLTG